ncbi:uncharacterized protein LOC117654309 [Thrips palmi]|uniref:Uncharacterized protein LOC117654309 n=1 Tax=Thrips palmi TaxID=161013 RepID=A0A6P9AH51_THRPL|nr:uncharacterized protein LOC117654309 [Thrips palmi]
MGKNGVTYLSTNNSRGAPKKVILEVCIHKELLEQVFKDNSKTINEYTYVVHGGVHCSKETAIVTKFVKDVPICGEIVAIYGTAEKLAFVYTKLATQKYELSLNAFKVCHTEKVAVILAEDIAYRHHVVFIREVGANFVILPSKSYLSHKY